jgi:peptidyl-prolyl cis-trans isomerase A (cyclophilin A)
MRRQMEARVSWRLNEPHGTLRFEPENDGGNMTDRSKAVAVAIAVLSTTALMAGQGNVERLKDPTQLTEQAPEAYRARFDTSQGAFVIAVERVWAPLAADRFYNLVRNGFYDDSRFFRVLEGFMVQFGLHADPSVQSAWRSANLKDEPVTRSNTRGFVSFTRESGPNSRYTMIFINSNDNSYLDGDGFAPFGQVVRGMEVVDRLYSGYGRQNVPDQRRILREGNAYLQADYPKLDFVKTATIETGSSTASSPRQP